MRSMTVLAGLLAPMALVAQTSSSLEQDPFKAPADMVLYFQRLHFPSHSLRQNLQAILSSIFRPEADGGLGVQYDNERTRTVEEVWRERKANCLSLTAFYLEACRSVSLEAKPAEAMNTNRWRRIGGMIRFERHVVALAQIPPLEDLVADFLPQMRRRLGAYMVKVLPPASFKALYYANRAVEYIDINDLDKALACAELATKVEPSLATCWNIRGVILNLQDQTELAEASFIRALKCDPGDSAAVGNLEKLMRTQGRFLEAIYFRNRGLELRKKDPYFQAFLAEEALGEGKTEEAEKRIKTAIKLHPYEPEFHLFLAKLQLNSGHMDDAAKALETARKWANPAERERFDNKAEALKRKREDDDRAKKKG